MLNHLFQAVKNWWLLLIIGIISIVLGIIVVFSPAGGFSALSIFLTIDMIATGIVGIIFVISNRHLTPAWGWQLILPILLVVFGVLIICQFGLPEIFLICFFAAGVLLKGIETIAYAISLSGVQGSGWGWTLVGGILLILFAGVIFANPLFPVLFLGYMFGFAMIFIGIDAIVVSAQLSRIKGAVKAAEREAEAVAEAVEQANQQ